MAHLFVLRFLVSVSVVMAEHAQFLAKSNNTAEPTTRLGSFMVIGDWGYHAPVSGFIQGGSCQADVSELMNQKFSELGDVRFVLNLGDSFYVRGVESTTDSLWEDVWRSKYSDELRQVPWYGVYGNHDYGEQACMCGDTTEECSQTQYTQDGWTMPGMSYNVPIPDMGLEIIAIDINKVDPKICDHATDCKQKCFDNLEKRYKESMDLLRERLADTTYQQILIIAHYPTFMWANLPELLEMTSKSDKQIYAYGGHIHSMAKCEGEGNCDAPLTPTPNVKAYLAGGGGGYFGNGDGLGMFGIITGVVQSNNLIDNKIETITASQCQGDCFDSAHASICKAYGA